MDQGGAGPLTILDWEDYALPAHVLPRDEERIAVPDPDSPPEPPDTVHRPWRCLDIQHSQGQASCARCHPPPTASCENDYVLLGDKGLKNGEKKLRALLLKTLEWCSDDDRQNTAEHVKLSKALNQEDTERLVRSLQAKDATLLRKTFLLLLCRIWRYKSDIWRSKVASAGTSTAAAACAPSSSWPSIDGGDGGEAASAAAPAAQQPLRRPLRQRPSEGAHAGSDELDDEDEEEGGSGGRDDDDDDDGADEGTAARSCGPSGADGSAFRSPPESASGPLGQSAPGTRKSKRIQQQRRVEADDPADDSDQ